MTVTEIALLVAAGIFAGTILSMELGFRLSSPDSGGPESRPEGTVTLEGAVFALLGLLLGFCFAGGMGRLESRRAVVIEEANAIGTAYLRLDLLTAESQPELRLLFRDYIDARLAITRNPASQDAQRLQGRIWKAAVAASRAQPEWDAAHLLLPAINEMIDVTTSRGVMAQTHQPMLLLALVSGLTLLSGLIAGYAMAKQRRRSWLHMFVYAMAMSVTIYTVVDLDYPREGLIRLGAADDALIELRNAIR